MYYLLSENEGADQLLFSNTQKACFLMMQLICQSIFSVIGTPFYIMEHVPGRIFQDALLKDQTPEERHLIYMEMINTLCKIHSVDIETAGLKDYGKEGLVNLFFFLLV